MPPAPKALEMSDKLIDAQAALQHLRPRELPPASIKSTSSRRYYQGGWFFLTVTQKLFLLLRGAKTRFLTREQVKELL